MVAPPLRHFDALIPMLAAMVGTAHGVAFTMSKRPLDGISFPQVLFRLGIARFVQQSGGHGAKAVRGHFVASEAQPPETCVDRVFRHWSGSGAD